MSKVVINPITSGYRSAEALNANFQQIEAEFENTLSLDGSSPNAMQSDLDMNSHKIANLGAPTTDTDVVRYIDMENYVAGHGGGGGGGGSGVVDAIVNGVTDVAPSQNAVFDALALKADAADLAGKSNVGHTHPESDITNLVSDLAGKASATHTHAESDITGLVSDLAGKAGITLTNVSNSDFLAKASAAGVTSTGGTVADAINDGITTVAPSQNAVFDALALKAATDLSNVSNPTFATKAAAAGVGSGGLVSITAYGAVCNGVTDDTAAWNSAIAAINSGAISHIFVPGVSNVTGTLTTVTGTMHIIGMGRAVSAIKHTGGGDVNMFNIAFTSRANKFGMRDISLYTTQANLGTAVHFSHIPAANKYIYGSTVDMENVDVVGYPNEISGGFKTGLYFKGIYNSTFVNVNVIGYVDPGLAYPDNIMVGTTGWYMDSEPLYWSINNRWTDCDVSNFNTAWKVRGHHEGLSWVTCCPAFVGNAWDIDTTVSDTSLTPYFGWTNCQTEFFVSGIIINNCSQIQIQDCQFYSNNSKNNSRNAVKVITCYQADVIDNIFVCGDSVGTTDMIVFQDVTYGQVVNNKLPGFKGYGIRFTGTSQYCEAVNNKMIAPYSSATLYLNDSSNQQLNKRRGQENQQFAGTTDYQTNVASNTSVGALPVNTPSDMVFCPFPVEVGDRIRVEVNSYNLWSSGTGWLQPAIREYTHRPSSGSPFQVIRHSVSQNNFAGPAIPLNANQQSAQFCVTAEFDVIGRAPDAQISVTMATQAGATGQHQSTYIRVTRV